MKTEKQVRANLESKLALYLNGIGLNQGIVEHIRMLDWVLNDGLVREMREIVSEYYSGK